MASGANNDTDTSTSTGTPGLCKRCESKGIGRPVSSPDSTLCQYCKFVNWKKDKKEPYLPRSESKGDTYGTERVYPQKGRGKQLPRDQIDATLKQIMSAKSRYSSEEAEANHLALYAKKPFVWKNSITRKFPGNTLEDRAKLAKKFKKHERFQKLCKGFPVRRIRSHQHYRETIRRALSVETRCRAVNYAYILLLDVELAKWETVHPEKCKRIWVEVCNELERKNSSVGKQHL